MYGSSTAFTPDANALAALTGKGNMPLITPAYAATAQFDPAQGPVQVYNLTGAMTLNAGTLNGEPGQFLVLMFLSDTTGRTVTFGTGFRTSVATLAGTASKYISIIFVSDGSNWVEVVRSVAVT